MTQKTPPLDDKELLIHIGMPKTGTTTLQAHLFHHIPNLTFWGKYDDDRAFAAMALPWIDDLRQLVNHADDFHVSEQSGAIGQQLLNALDTSETLRNLISLEGIGNPFVDLHNVQPKDIYRKAHHLAEVVDLVRSAGVRVRILMTLRPQEDLLPSLFSQIYFHGFACGLYGNSFDAFLDFMFEDTLIGQGHALYFDRLIDTYAGLFGTENVSYVGMRGLFSGQECSDVQAMAAYLSCTQTDILSALSRKKSNVRKTTIQGKAYTRMMVHSPAARMLKARTGMNAEKYAFSLMDRIRIWRGRPVLWKRIPQDARIMDYYAASNARLADHYKLVLS